MKVGMNLSDIKALVIEDNVYKTVDIKRALSFCGINNVTIAGNQEAGFNIIYESEGQGSPVGLIITDMHYPLESGTIADREAGFKLIDKLKKEEIEIPVIICSTLNYKVPDILGTVWYNDLRDLNIDFKEILEKLK